MHKPITTLFMLMSVDGKISTGDNDSLDLDQDFPHITGICEGLPQYYEIEQTTDLYSLNSGRVLAKIGINNQQKDISKTPVSYLVIDNQPHLTSQGITNLLAKSNKLFIITTNPKHLAFLQPPTDNLKIIYYPTAIDFIDLFHKLKENYNIQNLTIQTGGTLNSIFLRANLIDHISIVIAPALIGGHNTSTLIDGPSLTSIQELNNIKALRLIEINKLNNSYIHLKYNIINNTQID